VKCIIRRGIIYGIRSDNHEMDHRFVISPSRHLVRIEFAEDLPPPPSLPREELRLRLIVRRASRGEARPRRSFGFTRERPFKRLTV